MEQSKYIAKSLKALSLSGMVLRKTDHNFNTESGALDINFK